MYVHLLPSLPLYSPNYTVVLQQKEGWKIQRNGSKQASVAFDYFIFKMASTESLLRDPYRRWDPIFFISISCLKLQLSYLFCNLATVFTPH